MSLAVAILAAGSARRFGSGKLDALLAGRPLGQWALDAAQAVAYDRLAVVVGDPPPQFAQGCELLVNERAQEGLGRSAAVAARWAAATGSDTLLMLLADMPLVSSATLARLVAALGPAAVAYPGDKPGAPACFPAALFPALEELTGDSGAAQVLRGLPEVELVEVPPEELRDVDTPADLEAVERLTRR